jgi:uncharacterized membrane protein YkvA (DUF1232 family)
VALLQPTDGAAAIRGHCGNVRRSAGVGENVAARYGPRRLAAFGALWRAVSQSRRPDAPGLGERVRALPRMVAASLTGRYRDVGRGRLALLVLAVAYLVSPVDLVPELFLAVLGLADDAVVALWLGGAFLVETDRYLRWERESTTGRTRPAAVRARRTVAWSAPDRSLA